MDTSTTCSCSNPNANDYDCADGSGNDLYYAGRVRVIGPDFFGLDRDGGVNKTCDNSLH